MKRLLYWFSGRHYKVFSLHKVGSARVKYAAKPTFSVSASPRGKTGDAKTEKGIVQAMNPKP